MTDVMHALAQLENAQLVRRTADLEPAYIFKHSLAMDSVYESMLKSRRAELHRAVAEAIENICGPTLEQNAAILALHYERAGIDDRAFSYSALAGDVAARAHAHSEALVHFDRALTLAQRLGDSSLNERVRKIFATRGRVLEVQGDHAAASENYNAMIAFAQRASDLVMEADGLGHLLTAQGIVGEEAAGEDQLLRALELARRSGDQELVGRALWNLGLAVRFRDAARAEEYFGQALELARRHDLHELEAYALTDLCVEWYLTGRSRRCLACGLESLEKFRALGNQPMIANALGMVAASYYDDANPAKARAACGEGLEISRAIENPWGIAYNEFTLLTYELDAGEFDRGITRGERISSIARDIGFPVFQGIPLLSLSQAYLELGQLGLARKTADRGLAVLERMQSPIWQSSAAGILGSIRMAEGDWKSAHALLDPPVNEDYGAGSSPWVLSYAGPPAAALALAEGRLDYGVRLCNALIKRFETEETWSRVCEMLYWRGRIYRAMEDLDSAEADLVRAGEIAARGEYHRLRWHIDAELARVFASQGDLLRAEAAHLRALAFATATAEKITSPSWRESFWQQPDASDMKESYVETRDRGR